jgi:aspartate/methionine/tyrosine aminotransferase
MAAYRMGYRKAAATIIEPTNASRAVLRDLLEEHGFTYILGKGYYAFIEVGEWLRAAGWDDSAELGKYLAEEWGVAIVPGVYFSRYGKDWVRFSYATPAERTRGAFERLVEGLDALASE